MTTGITPYKMPCNTGGPGAYHMAALTRIICNVQTALKAQGLRLHSQDVAPWGTYENFNMSALVQVSIVHTLPRPAPHKYATLYYGT